jgi:hypothetical protein
MAGGAAIALYAVLSLSLSCSYAACNDYIAQTQDAIEQAQLEQIGLLITQLHQQIDCPHEFLRDVERAMAQIAAQRAQQLLSRDHPEAAAAVLQQAPLATWETQYLYGEIAAREHHWDSAIGHYNQAYALLDDPNQTPNPPPPDTIGLIRERALEAQLILGDVSYTLNRGGEPVGVMRPLCHPKLRQRGIGIEKWPAPVQFETDQPAPDPRDKSGASPVGTGFTSAGERNAGLLAAFVKQQGYRQITLTGHTDERGSASYNQTLSLRRANALRDFLQQQGIAAVVIAAGKGETEPNPLAHPKRHNQQEIWTLNRRVELEPGNASETTLQTDHCPGAAQR